MSTSIEIERTAPPEHSFYRFCAPLVQPDKFESTMAFHCEQYVPFSKVKNGIYKMDVKIYQKGKLVKSLPGTTVSTNAILDCNFSDLVEDKSTPALAIVEITHPSDHYIDPYVNHRHRTTGCIVTHPLVLFMGQENLGEFLGSALENSLFWPSLVIEDKLESVLIVANPYDHSLGFQVSVYGDGANLFTSKVLRLSPHNFEAIKIEELFPELSSIKDTAKCLDYSICVSTQYAAKALFGIRHRETGYYSTIDHLHEYVFR
jgi:hypothetical protein